MPPREAILSRLYVVLAALLLLPAGVVAQMVRIHVGEGALLREQGREQAASFVEIPAVRGAILDVQGRALAVNTARYEVAADPTVPGFDGRADELYTLLGELTDEPASRYRRRVEDRASRQYVRLVRALGEAEKEQLDAAGFPGLLIEGDFERRYTYGSTGAHVLGHVDTDGRGLAGLEAQFDAALRGEPGRRAVHRDRRGHIRALVGGAVVEPRHGESLTLTLDLVRQALMEEELARGVQAAGARWGTAVAMDPRTGAILALANAPEYDPNHPGRFSAEAMRNHALVDRIEPGSTFKLVTAVAALETAGVDPEDLVDTGPGWAVIRGRTMRDSHPYGRIAFGEALVKSSNIAMARTALDIEPGDFYQYARNLGFGQPTHVDLPGEITGRLKRPGEWGRLTLPWMSTGYEVEATPLQILTAYAALANGGLLVQPHVVAARHDALGRTTWRAQPDSIRRAFRAETAARLTPYFERVVSREGTAPLAAVPGLRIAGKTGTAQTAAGGVYARSYRATFVGFFPVEAPEVALIVVLDGPTNGYYGGSVAAPVFGAIARRWIGTFPSIAQRVAPADRLPTRSRAEAPALAGWPTGLAAARLRAEGIAVAPVSAAEAWRPVAEQRPVAGAVALAEPVRLVAATHALQSEPPARPTAADAPGPPERVTPSGAPAAVRTPSPARSRVMPDLRGLSARQAVAWLAALGVAPRVEGSGVVRTQRPAAGTRLTESATLTCR